MTDKSEILHSIKNRIEYSKSDSILNHFKTVFLIQRGLSGTINSGGFKIWTFGHLLGIFYPVISGSFVMQDGILTLKISSKLNSLGLMTALLLSVIWIGVVTSMVLQGNNNWEYLWKRSILGLILLAIPFVTLGYVIFRNHQMQRKEVKDECQHYLRKHTGSR